MQLHGKPQTIISDQGKGYTSHYYIQFCDQQSIKASYTSTYNPTANSVVERTNKTIKNILRIYRYYPINKIIKIINLRLNIFAHRIMKATPFELRWGYNWFDPDQKPSFKLTEALEYLYNAGKGNESKANTKRVQSYKYKTNDSVLIRRPNCSGLEPLYDGPYTIIRIDKTGNRVEVHKGDNSTWENIKRLKPFRGGRCGVSPHKNAESVGCLAVCDIYNGAVEILPGLVCEEMETSVVFSLERKGKKINLQADWSVCQKVYKS